MVNDTYRAVGNAVVVIGPSTGHAYQTVAFCVDDKTASAFAAAPDLLEAAKEAYEWMNGLPIPTTGCSAKMQVLYNAIAKAGEAK